MLEVRQVPGAGLREQGEILPMNCFLRATYTGSPQAELISLTFTECVVTVKGRDLAGLRPLLMSGHIEFLQEFSADRWSEPAIGEAVIWSLQVEERR